MADKYVDPLLIDLQTLAIGVISRWRSSCLGLETDDLVAEGWLQYHRALSRGDSSRGDPHKYAMISAKHSMRRAVMQWLGYSSKVEMIQLPRITELGDTDEYVPPVLQDAPTDDAALYDVTPHEVLASLDDEARDILERYYLGKETPKEIAAARGCTTARVSRRRYTAIETLRARAGNPSPARLRAQARVRAWQAEHRDEAYYKAAYLLRRSATFALWLPLSAIATFARVVELLS